MDKLFPGLTEELDQLGSPKLYWDKLHTHFPTGWVRHFENGPVTNLVTRVSLEWLLRKRIAAIATVTTLGRSDVGGPLADETRARITGIAIKSRQDQSQP